MKQDLITFYTPTKLPIDEQFEQLTELTMKKGEKVQTYFNSVMKKTEHLGMPESQKTILFKRGLPKYIKRYIKAEKPKNLRGTLIRAKEAEELGKDHDADEDIKSLQDSMSALLAKLDKPTKASVSALSNMNTGAMKCAYCHDTQHLLNNCPTLHGVITRNNDPGIARQTNFSTTQSAE